IYADELDLARQVIEPWGDESPFDEGLVRQIHANIASYLMLEQGEAERARYRQAISRTEGDRTMPQIHGAMAVALSYLHEGRPRLAEEIARPTQEWVEAMTGRRNAASCILAPALAPRIGSRIAAKMRNRRSRTAST